MRSDRTTVTAVLGGLNLLVGLTAVLAAVLILLLTWESRRTAEAYPDPHDLRPDNYLRRRLVGYREWEGLYPATLAVAGAFQVVSGIGLLRGGRWGRLLAVLVAGGLVFFVATALVVDVGYILPALESWRSRDVPAARPRPTPAQLSAGSGQILGVVPVMRILVGLVMAVESLAVLAALVTPGTREARAGPAPMPGSPA